MANGTGKCFQSFEEVTEEVDQWFEKYLKEYSLAQALCGYNRGFKSKKYYQCLEFSPEVPYLRNFLALAGRV